MTKAHFHVLFMRGCCVYSSSVKQCLQPVNNEQFAMQMTHNYKHSKCLKILAEEDFPLKLLWRTSIKIHRRANRRRQPWSREHRLAQWRQCRQHSDHKRVQRQQQNTPSDEERDHRLPTLPKATRLDQATRKVYSQNYLLRCSDRQQELCTSRISSNGLGTADQPLHHEKQWVLQ